MDVVFFNHTGSLDQNSIPAVVDPIATYYRIGVLSGPYDVYGIVASQVAAFK
jgi:hypothetical protein